MDELTVLTWRVPSHGTGAVEDATLPDDARAKLLHDLRTAAGAQEVSYLATCQRVVLTLLHARPNAAAAVHDVYRSALGRDLAPVEAHAGREAFHHLARVAASLDSFVVGEPQILGQVKESARVSETDGVSGPGLRHVFGLILRAAKAVRAETDLFRGKTSLIPLTESLLEERLASEPAPRVAIFGTGETGQRMAELLRTRWPGCGLDVVSRDAGRAARAATALAATPHTLDAFLAAPPAGVHAIVLTMRTQAPVLAAKDLERLALPAPLLVLDLALPRNAEAPDADVPGLRLVQMDELSRISEANLALRKRELAHAEEVLERELCRIDEAYAVRHVAPDLQDLTERFQRAADARLQDLPASVRADPELAKWYDQTVRALLHEATQTVRKVGRRQDKP